MIRQYFKQTLQTLKENPLVNIISILGTALSIAMIMVLILVFQINNAGYAPESHRNQMLFIDGIEASNGDRQARGSMSVEVVKECFYSLDIPEAVSAIVARKQPISLPTKRLFKEYNIIYTDPGFWKVFDFNFLHGNSFSETDFQSGIQRAVISADLAKLLFGSADAIGQTILINYIPYTVSGVVKTVSKAATHAYADVWIPYSTLPSLLINDHNEGISGGFQTVILASSTDRMNDIRSELDNRVASYNNSKEEYKLSLMNNPLNQTDIAIGSSGFRKIPIREYLLNAGSILLFLLLIPALNLIGVVQSSIQRRKAEVGIRKAFGATTGKMTAQFLSENLIITSLGGILGFALSFILLMLCKSFLLSGSTLITADMLLKPEVFIGALLFVLLLNLLSAGIPAIRISRKEIVTALNEND